MMIHDVLWRFMTIYDDYDDIMMIGLREILTGNHGFYQFLPSNWSGFPVKTFPSSNSMNCCIKTHGDFGIPKNFRKPNNCDLIQ